MVDEAITNEVCDAEFDEESPEIVYFGDTPDLYQPQSCNKPAVLGRFDVYVDKDLYACEEHKGALQESVKSHEKSFAHLDKIQEGGRSGGNDD